MVLNVKANFKGHCAASQRLAWGRAGMETWRRSARLQYQLIEH